MLVPLGLTRSNEAATRNFCRGNNEPRRRAKALHRAPYSSSHQTQPPRSMNQFRRRAGARWSLSYTRTGGSSRSATRTPIAAAPHADRPPRNSSSEFRTAGTTPDSAQLCLGGAVVGIGEFHPPDSASMPLWRYARDGCSSSHRRPGCCLTPRRLDANPEATARPSEHSCGFISGHLGPPVNPDEHQLMVDQTALDTGLIASRYS